MGLRFILGRAGTGKSGRAFDEIKEKSIKDPQGQPIFYLVPDQMTFEQEYSLFEDEALQGSIRTQVVSFSRLAWRILQETGGAVRQFISSVGLQMMLRKIIEEKNGDWKVFQKAIEKQGFLEQLESMITEFKRYQITPEILAAQKGQLDQFVHKDTAEIALTQKLEDLIYIYEKLVIALEGNYIDGEDQLQLLTEKIPEANLLEDAEIYFDGFHQFTPNELAVVEMLLKKCKRVTVLLTVGELEDENVSDLDLFYQTSETFYGLEALAKDNQIPIEEIVRLKPEDGRFKERPYFYHLEQYFNERPSPAFEGNVPVKVVEAVHPRAEVEGAAQEILRLVREESYRFKDVAIFIRQTDVYHDLIDTVFEDYQIPVFIDEKKSMLNHPLVEFIRSIFDTVEGNWRYEPLFRALKTGFIPSSDARNPLTEDAIDELENYILEYGIRSRERWFNDKKWVFQRFRGFDEAAQTSKELLIQERINAYRNQVTKDLRIFDTEIRACETVREFCETTYRLLEKIKAPNRLEKMREFFDNNGSVEKGREQEQVWDTVIQLLDEMVEMVGDEPMKLSTFRSVLDAGFETLKFSHVPPTIDHVIVGSVDHSRISGIKASFLLGVNEGVWPLKPPSDGIISENERDVLAFHGLELAETSKRQLLDDWFYMYTVFTSARDYLWLSYPISDEEGKTKMPSQLVSRIDDLLPGSDHLLLQEADELIDAERFISTPVKTRSALTAQLARYQKGYTVKSEWWHVLNWYINNEEKYGTTYMTLRSLYYKNEPVNLKKDTVGQLYPKQIKTSVSRLESYYQCSYKHFAGYSLGLQERKTYKLDAPDIGLLFHEALKTIMEWIKQEGRDFGSLTQQDSKGYAQKAVDKLSPILQHQILHSSNRYQYIQRKLQEVIARATLILSEQTKQSDFTPVGLELEFGEDKQLNPLTLSLPNGFELILRGQIDRVDKSTTPGQLYLRIIDYKSSSRELNLVHVYYGIALQMLTYLDVVLTESEEWLGLSASPAGVLYFHVHNPMIANDNILTDEKLADEIFKRYKMKGLLLADEQIVSMMDRSLETGVSQIIPAGIKKDGSFRKGSRIAEEQTFDNLRNHMHELMIGAGIDITNGGVRLNPYQYKQETACTFCPFLSVCQFDPTLETNEYHNLNDMKDDEVLVHLRQENLE